MSIDLSKAKEIIDKALTDANNEEFEADTNYNDFLLKVIEGSHKTYKYILFNALLAKSTDENVNMLVLQAGSKLKGAYDARSLCHSVVVPFESDNFPGALGGSNEPFVNKPARFTELSKSNAVRKGKDKELLDSLCDTLPEINSVDAYKLLVFAIRKLISIYKELESQRKISYKSEKPIKEICAYINELSNQSFEGETIVLIVAAVYEMYMSSIYEDYNVEVHPVNQSGSSSREISDIDVYKQDEILITNELKDKLFTETDVKHAITKIIDANCSKMFFIKGKNATLVDCEEKKLEAEMLEQGIYLKFYTVEEFTDFIFGLTCEISVEKFYESIINNALDKKFKKNTIEFINSTAKQYGWIE